VSAELTLSELALPVLLGEPASQDRRARKRFWSYVQKWRAWLHGELCRSQPGDIESAQQEVDDLLSLVLLIQFIRDRDAEAAPPPGELGRRLAGSSVRQLCEALQAHIASPVLKTVFAPDHFAENGSIPARVWQSTFADPLIRASRKAYGSRLPVTILGDFHQWCLAHSPDEESGPKQPGRSGRRRYDKGIHYTPGPLVDYLTARALGGLCAGLSLQRIADLRILDPACGSGVFLVAALRYLIARLEQERRGEAASETDARLTLQEWLNVAATTIFGSDLDARAVAWAIRSLLLTAWEGATSNCRETGGGILVQVPDLRQNVVSRDFLASAPACTDRSISVACPEIDLVLGGPPFVHLQQLHRSAPAALGRYRRQFRTAQSGQFDLYMLFMERAIERLKEQGWLAFSVSSTFLRSDSGRRLRRLIGETCQVHEIIEFEDRKIYPDAVTQIALVLLQKTAVRSPGRHVWVRGPGQLREKLSALASGMTLENPQIEVRPLAADACRQEQWSFQSANEAELLARLKSVGTPLGDLPVYIGQGVVTGADEVFLLRAVTREVGGEVLVEQRETGRQFLIESALLRPIVRNRDIRGYTQSSPPTLCLVPYDASGKLLPESVLRSDYPRTYHYLLSCRERFAARRLSGQAPWYAFRAGNPFRFSQRPQVIGGLVTSGGDFTNKSDPLCLCHSGVLVMVPNKLLIDPYYLLGICNSVVFWAFIRQRMPTMGEGRHTLRLERLREFRLDVFDTEHEPLRQQIATLARHLLADPLTKLARSVLKADIDKAVCELYGVSASRPRGS
jgi:hypothetical protein